MNEALLGRVTRWPFTKSCPLKCKPASEVTPAQGAVAGHWPDSGELWPAPITPSSISIESALDDVRWRSCPVPSRFPGTDFISPLAPNSENIAGKTVLALGGSVWKPASHQLEQ